MIFLSYAAVLVLLIAYPLAALRFTTHGHGRHSAETVKCWPLLVRGTSADVPVLETGDKVTFRVGSQPEAVA